MKVIGLDVGGTKIEAALFSGNVIIKKAKRKTEAERGRNAVLKNITNTIRAVFAPGVAAIGVAIAGPTDPKKGVLLESPHIPCLVGIPVKSILEKEFKVKVVVDNDARMFARGVQKFYRVRNLVALTLGTGVGGAAIISGRLEKNPRSTKGEIGHIVVRKNGRKCACGARGCLEAYASGWAIEKRYRERSGRKLSAYRKVVRRSCGLADAKELAGRGNKISKEVIGEAGDYLAKGLVIITEKYRPELIVIGGGVSNIEGLLTGANVVKTKMKNGALLGAKLYAEQNFPI